MAKAAKTELDKGDRVVAAAELRGVPAGTEGKVVLVSGLSWVRYWVRFDNGVAMGSIGRAKLATPSEWKQRLEAPDEPEAAAGEQEAGESAVEGGAAVGEGKTVNGVLVPPHLLERTQRARERLGG